MGKENLYTTDFYIVSDDFKLIEFNDSVKKMYKNIKPGDYCYKATMKRTTPCPHCPIANNISQDSSIFYDPYYRSWLEAIFSKIDEHRYAVTCRAIDPYLMDKYQQVKATTNELLINRTDDVKSDETHFIDRLVQASHELISNGKLYRQDQLFSNRIVAELQKMLKAAIWTISLDTDGKRVACYRSKEYLEILGFKDKTELPDDIPSFAQHVHPDDLHKVVERFEAYIDSKDPNKTYDITYRFRDAYNNYRWIHSVAKLIRDEQGRPELCIGMDADVTTDHELDKLTDGINRVGFLRIAENFLQHSPKNNYAILYFNLIKFKAFNEFSGTENGDYLLKGFYDYILNSPLKIICLGRQGDHFFCLAEDNAELIHNIEKLCSFSYDKLPIPVNIYARCGICKTDGSNTNITNLLDRAQLAERLVTDEYIKPYAIFDGVMHENYVDEAFTISEIDKALETGQIKVYYQPIIDTSTGKIASAEALARWVHPERGLIPTTVFIPALEKNGYISKLDSYVLRQVKSFYSQQLQNNLPLVPVSVNISWMDFYDDGLIDHTIKNFNSDDLPKELMRIEITESSYMAMNNNASESIINLRNLGAKFLLDDFGTGYSSFDMLQKYSFDILKIDKSFTAMLGINKKTEQLVQSIIEMCHHIGIKTVAEGVETAEQLRFYRNHSCDYIQGYYFYKPMPQDKFAELLDDMNTRNMLIDYHSNGPDTPVSFYKAALYYTSQEMYRKTSITTDIISELIGQNLGVGVVSGLYDGNYSLSYVSYLFLRLLGCSYNEMMEQCGGSYLNLIAPEDRDFYVKNTNMEKFYSLMLKDGIRFPVKEFCYNVRTANGERQWISSVRRLDALDEDNKKRLETIYTLAEYDTFTKLLNKTPFFEKVDSLLQSKPDASCTMILFDIDNFKTVNDLCGHNTGDRIILSVSEIINNAFRGTDLVGRFGGDEFVVFMQDCNNVQLIKEKIEAIQHQLANQVYLESLSRMLTISAGFCCSNGSLSRIELFDKADKALYQAKVSGKNTYRQYLF